MDGAALIQKVQEAGAEIALAGNKITVRHVSRLPDALRHLLQQNKGEVIRTLREFSLPNFCRLVQHYGADSGVLLEESAILSELDTDGIADLQAASTATRQSWAESIAIRLVQARGIVPKGWDRVAHCQHCGPVWAEHDLPTLSCGWCWMRLAGKRLPQPDFEICQRCGASMQATHHELCESRDGTPTGLDDATVRRLIRQEHPARQ